MQNGNFRLLLEASQLRRNAVKSHVTASHSITALRMVQALLKLSNTVVFLTFCDSWDPIQIY